MFKDFSDHPKYEGCGRVLYGKTLQYRPKTIVELGYGSGGVTVAFAAAVKEYGGKVYSFDLKPSDPVRDKLSSVDLLEYVSLTSEDVYQGFLRNPFSFDLLYIDLDLNWDQIYNILVDNRFIYDNVKRGSKVFIEGGNPNHPRVNMKTLETFTQGRSVFKLDILCGQRTSISELSVLL